MNDKDYDYFPLKIALGERFCNRVDERSLLKRNVKLVRHTVLISPRRYGKTSLVYCVMNEMEMPFAIIDLFLAHDDRTVVKRILDGISEVISKILPISSKILTLIQEYFVHFKIGLTSMGYSIELTHESGSVVESVDRIFDALKSLTKLAESQKKKAILFLDEFQDIANSESAKSIQGAIRHVAQSTEWIVFIFSGSNRNLLLDLFDDKKKPLYMLCDKIFLERMTAESYIPHLQKLALKRWGETLDENIVLRILTLTERHPFYVNMLCDQLWMQESKLDLPCVLDAWEHCYEQEKRRLVAELEKLTTNQQDLLKTFSVMPTHEPTGQHFVSLSGLAGSTVKLGMNALIKKDMLYQLQQDDALLPSFKKGQYRVLDPLLAFALRKYSN